MKCPKCHYLGFETGDRCRNCGYDFSLLADAVAPDPDIALHVADSEQASVDLPLNESLGRDLSHGSLDALMVAPAPTPSAIELVSEAPVRAPSMASAPDAMLRVDADAPSLPVQSTTPRVPVSSDRPAGSPRWQDRSLPLFSPSTDDEDDTPLVRLPATPRPPLSVRRTADHPRLRAIAKPLPAPEPDLGFAEAPAADVAASTSMHRDEDVRSTSPVWRPGPVPLSPGGAFRRLTAAVIDYVILLSIDAAVVYFTLRMVSAGPGDWRLLPPVPLILFLALLKLGYFGMFTAMGGQTIGKMATRIRVVSEDGRNLGASESVRRTLAGALTALTMGLGFLPALAGEHRALHDRLARTRVVLVDEPA